MVPPRRAAPPPVRYSPNHRTLEAVQILHRRCLELARAHGWQRDMLEWLLDKLDGLGPIDSPSPRDSVDAVVDDLIPLAAHRTQVVEGHLAGARAASRGYHPATGDDAKLGFRVHLEPLMDGSGAI